MTEKQKLITKLRMTNHVYHTDAGHGWLKVSLADIKTLEITDQISGFSYQNAGQVYLEEDLDAITYLKALFPMGFQTEMYRMFEKVYVSEVYDGDESKIRHFKSYSK